MMALVEIPNNAFWVPIDMVDHFHHLLKSITMPHSIYVNDEKIIEFKC